MLNEFTLSLGLNDMNDEERQVLERNMAEIGAEPLSLQTYTTDPGMEELSALFDGTDQAATLTPMLTGVDRFLSGIRMALVRSCGVADHDVAANHALKEVVDGMRNCVFDEARLP
jgi:hypothetical protein